MAERRPVPGWEGFYDVDTDGNVYSLPRVVICRNGVRKPVRARTLSHAFDCGYPMVTLKRAGEQWSVDVHRLVALAFLGAPPDGMEVLHGDGDRGNPKLSNLRYGTRLENAADAERHGTRARGERQGSSRLTEAAVRTIRRRVAAGETHHAVAVDFGVTGGAILKVARRLTWRHVA